MSKQYIPQNPRPSELVLKTVHVWNDWNMASNGAHHAEILSWICEFKITAEWQDRNSVTRLVEFTLPELDKWYSSAYKQYRRNRGRVEWQECVIATMPEMPFKNSQLAA